MNTIGTPLFFNLTNRPWCKTLSKLYLHLKIHNGLCCPSSWNI